MSIDYESLRDNLLLNRKISAKKHKEYVDDEDALPNEIHEGKKVLSLGWDGAPGCSGAIWIDCWNRYYFCHSSDYDSEGPFNSLDDALDLEYFHTDTAYPELHSKSLKLQKLLEIARKLISEEGDQVLINQARYELRSDKLFLIES